MLVFYVIITQTMAYWYDGAALAATRSPVIALFWYYELCVRLFLKHLKPLVVDSLNPLQFAYTATSSCEDEVLILLQHLRHHFEHSGSSVRVMFLIFHPHLAPHNRAFFPIISSRYAVHFDSLIGYLLISQTGQNLSVTRNINYNCEKRMTFEFEIFNLNA